MPECHRRATQANVPVLSQHQISQQKISVLYQRKTSLRDERNFDIVLDPKVEDETQLLFAPRTPTWSPLLTRSAQDDTCETNYFNFLLHQLVYVLMR